MSKKKKLKKNTNFEQFEKVVNGKQLEKSNTLIYGGVLIAISSIGLLFFVLSEKIFHLS